MKSLFKKILRLLRHFDRYYDILEELKKYKEELKNKS